MLEPSHEASAVVIPSNRGASGKVAAVRAKAPVQVVEHPRGERLPDNIPAADAVLSWLYSQLIAPEDLERYARGGLNMHGGRLPDYRGASVLQWAIINGEERMGVTWHTIAAQVDAGAILAESQIPIPADATAADMRAIMIEEGLRLFPEAWRRFTTEAAPVRRIDPAEGRVWPQRKPSDGRIEEGWPERQVRDMVRALCPPWPPASIEQDGIIYNVRAVHAAPGNQRLAYRSAEGTILYLEADPVRS